MGELRGKRLQRRIEMACAVMFMLYGFDAGVLGGVIDTPQFLNSIGNPTGKYDIALVTSSYTLAAFVATPLVMTFGWKTGRRKILLAGCLTVIIGGIIQASAVNVPHIIVGRIICGFGIGFISSTVPVYQNETSIDKDTRGRKMAITCSCLIFGIPFAYDYGMSFVNNSVSWRLPIASQIIPAFIGGWLFWACPDSPRWYYGKGRDEDGDRVLSQIWDLPITHPTVAAEKRGILAAIQLEENAAKPKISEYFWDRSELKVARRLVICFLVLSFQQLMAINFLVYYATIIFRQNGVSRNVAAILGATSQTVYWFGTLITIPLIDKVGRRGLMFYTACICTALMTVFVALLNLPASQITPTTNWVASAFIIIYLLPFGCGWIAPCWQYAPEISPLEYRHVGAALNASGEWLWSFVTVFASPIALDDPKTGPKIWFWYFAFNVLAIPFTYFLPETAGKNLEELDVLFCKDPAIRDRVQNERQAVLEAAEKAVEGQIRQDSSNGSSGYKEGSKAEQAHEEVVV